MNDRSFSITIRVVATALRVDFVSSTSYTPLHSYTSSQSYGRRFVPFTSYTTTMKQRKPRGGCLFLPTIHTSSKTAETVEWVSQNHIRPSRTSDKLFGDNGNDGVRATFCVESSFRPFYFPHHVRKHRKLWGYLSNRRSPSTGLEHRWRGQNSGNHGVVATDFHSTHHSTSIVLPPDLRSQSTSRASGGRRGDGSATVSAYPSRKRCCSGRSGRPSTSVNSRRKLGTSSAALIG